MSDETNWRQEINAQDYFGHQKKKNQVADRRPVIRRPSDLVGPGIAEAAVPITDYNDPLATFNGYFSSTRAANGPRPEVSGPDTGFDTNRYVGTVTMDGTLGGVQTMTDIDTGSEYTRVFLRAPTDPGAITWGAWRVEHRVTPTVYAADSVATTVPSFTGEFLTPPELNGVNWEGTYESTNPGPGGGVFVLEQGVYTGTILVTALGSFAMTVVVTHPNMLTSATIAVEAPTAQDVLVPFTFINERVTPADIVVMGLQATGANQEITWAGLNLTRVGNAI